MTPGQETAGGLIIGILAIRWLANGRLQRIFDSAFHPITNVQPTDPFSTSLNPLAPVNVGAGGDQAYDPFSSLSLGGTVASKTVVPPISQPGSHQAYDVFSFVPSGIINYTSAGHLLQYKVDPKYLPSFAIDNSDPAASIHIPSQYIYGNVLPNIPNSILIDGMSPSIPGTLPTRRV